MTVYIPKRVAVTGGLGFIGGHFVRRLLASYPTSEIIILDAVTYAANKCNISDFKIFQNVTFVQGSVGVYDDVQRALRGCDTVFHFAAETHVPRSFENPDLFFETNATGSQNVAAACLANKVRRLLHISTDEVYGPTLLPVTETADLNPTTAYAKSKVVAENAIKKARLNGLDALILRPTNVIGVGQHHEKVLPKFVELALSGHPLPIEGNGKQTRTLLPVLDAVTAIETAWLKSSPSQTYNISGNEVVSIVDLAEIVIARLKSKSQISFVEDRQVNDCSYLIDDTAIRALGYRQLSTLHKEIQNLAAAISYNHKTQLTELAS